jgi:hypothetical protein
MKVLFNKNISMLYEGRLDKQESTRVSPPPEEEAPPFQSSNFFTNFSSMN